MVEPHTLIDQLEQDDFREDVCLAMIVPMSTYDSVR